MVNVPKIVDHEQRRREIGESVMEVIATDGLDGLTVRKIASASGWSTGVLTHYVRDKEELIQLAIGTMAEAFIERLETNVADTPVESVRLLLRELLPFDAQRRTEALIWFRLATYDPAGDGASNAIRRGHRELRKVVAARLADAGIRRDPSEVAAELVALADGLAIHHIIDPRGMPRTKIAATLDARLSEI